MKIAIAQLNYTIGDIEGNASKIIEAVNQAKADMPIWSFSQSKPSVAFPHSICSAKPPFWNSAKKLYPTSHAIAKTSPPSSGCLC